MNDDEYEGSLVLERLSEEGLLDDFMEAIDQDDILQAVSFNLECENIKSLDKVM